MHIFVFLCLAVLFGCFCGIKFAAINILLVLLGLCLVFAVKLVIFERKTVGNLYVLILVFCYCCGVGFGIYHDCKAFSKIKPLYGTDVTMTGIVTETEEENFAIDTEYGRLWVYNYIGAEVEKGNTVELRGSLDSYETAQYNGGFDNRLHNALYGIVGNVTCQWVNMTGNDESFSIWDLGAYVRKRIENTVQSSMASSESKGFVTALLTGNTALLDESVKDAFKVTGISHLTAVSGLHVGIFLSFFVIFSRGVRGNKFVHFLFILILVVMYTVLIGERASVYRAGIMSVISYIMFAVKRRSDPLTNLMIAGILICFVNPYYVVDPGFQMSFTATLGLVLFVEFFKYSVFAVPVIATVFMLPITLYYYNSVSLTTVPVNIIAVFLVPFVILTGYIGCLVPLFLYVSCAVSELIITVAEFFASMEYLHFTLPSPDARQFLMWIFVILAFWFFINKKQYSKMAIMLAGAFLIGVSGFVEVYIEDECCYVRFINSGNYNMQHITTENGEEIFVDCGSDAYDYTVKNGINDIYAVFITGSDASRSEGLEKLCSNRNVGYVVLPDSLRDKNLNLEKCRVLYYNQGNCEFTVDGVTVVSAEYREELYVAVQIYERIIAIPSGKTVADTIPCDVMCVPDGCKDIPAAAENMHAEFYIHPTHKYQYYDYGNKYITSQVGMVKMIFKKDTKPVLPEF